MPAIRANSRTSYAVSITTALLVARGLELLMQAAAMPLETVLTRLTNVLVVQGWRNVATLYEARYPLAMVGSTVFSGLVLLVAGLLLGNKIVSWRNAELSNQRKTPGAGV